MFGIKYKNISLKEDETYKVVCIKTTFFILQFAVSTSLHTNREESEDDHDDLVQ